eukprot:scaffold2832_cov132-Skeletonema_dohrnii-CCMP3373.AAC.6
MTPSITAFYVISRHVLPMRRRAISCCYRTATLTVHTRTHPHSDQAVTVDASACGGIFHGTSKIRN